MYHFTIPMSSSTMKRSEMRHFADDIFSEFVVLATKAKQTGSTITIDFTLYAQTDTTFFKRFFVLASNVFTKCWLMSNCSMKFNGCNAHIAHNALEMIK